MINIENYEEYFLLYVDDELPAELRAVVERFVADHPQFREELESMLQCRLRPDPETSFPDKAALFHKVTEEASWHNYEESLLAYVDGELDGREKAAVEALVEQHPSAAEELDRLRLTVSNPDPAVVFPGKSRLYRYEKGKRAVLLPWLRAGVAAAVLAVAALLLLSRGRKEAGQPLMQAKNIPVAVTPATPGALHSTKKEEKGSSKLVARDREAVSSREAASASSRSRGIPDKPVTGNEPVIAQIKTAIDTAAGGVAVTEIDHVKTLPANTVAVVNIPKEQSSFATQALLQEEQESG